MSLEKSLSWLEMWVRGPGDEQSLANINLNGDAGLEHCLQLGKLERCSRGARDRDTVRPTLVINTRIILCAVPRYL